MKTELTRAIGECTRATLVFDLERVARNMREVANAARAADVRALFAMKSFPRDEVRALAAEHLDGFDVSSPGELDVVPASGIISIVDPTGLAIERSSSLAVERASSMRGRRLLVGCETQAQISAAPARAELGIRISASITGRDPAVGAILDGTGHRASRFGVSTPDEVRALVATVGDRPVGIHVHHGPVTATSVERFIATARAAIALLGEAGREPAFLDLGGAWHGIADLGAAFAELRTAFPGLELIVEPGRTFTHGAGFASGAVLSTRETSDRIVAVVELSRSCHLRWSQPELIAPAPRADLRRKAVLVGPTCYEDDLLGEWIVEPTYVELGRRIVLANITGYAAAWNTGFGGIPPADLRFVE